MPYRLIPRTMRERIGHRGLILLLFGCAWIVQGAAFFVLHDLFVGLPAYFPLDRLPLWLQGSLWIGSGVLSVWAGLRHREADDTVGFVSVSLMPMLITASAAAGTITYLFAGSDLWKLGALTVLAWLPLILALSVVASWYEPPIRSGHDG